MMSRPHFKITRHEFQNVKMAFRGRADTNSQAVIRKLMFQTSASRDVDYSVFQKQWVDSSAPRMRSSFNSIEI